MSEDAGREALRRVVADFFEAAPEQVDDAFRIAGPRMHSSIARAALDAAIRKRLGVASRAPYLARTFGELAAGLFGAEAATGPAPPPGAAAGAHSLGAPDFVRTLALALASGGPAPEGGVACGIDVEMVENLPPARDYWRHAFYEATFTPAEIAYCLLQEDPRVHLAARWCAKEALKKCDNRFLAEPMATLEVAREASGAVYLRHAAGGAPPRLPFALSIAHTASVAAAVVARAPPEPLPAGDPSPRPSASRAGPAPAGLDALWRILRERISR